MKAVVVYKAGGPEALQYREVPTPEARPGWTLVKVRGVGVNHSEVFTREGKSPLVSFPRILGIECVGQVERTFNPRLHAGQTVISIMGEMGRAFDGGYAQYALLPDEQVYPVSTSLPWSNWPPSPRPTTPPSGRWKGFALRTATTCWCAGRPREWGSRS